MLHFLRKKVVFGISVIQNCLLWRSDCPLRCTNANQEVPFFWSLRLKKIPISTSSQPKTSIFKTWWRSDAYNLFQQLDQTNLFIESSKGVDFGYSDTIQTFSDDPTFHWVARLGLEILPSHNFKKKIDGFKNVGVSSGERWLVIHIFVYLHFYIFAYFIYTKPIKSQQISQVYLSMFSLWNGLVERWASINISGYRWSNHKALDNSDFAKAHRNFDISHTLLMAQVEPNLLRVWRKWKLQRSF